MLPPEKTMALSTICSNKQLTQGHKARLDFLEDLNQHLGSDFSMYGYGRTPVVDKWDALWPYHYHLVVENTCIKDYWSEKLADAFLAFCMPIVWGCTNLNDYFPPRHI